MHLIRGTLARFLFCVLSVSISYLYLCSCTQNGTSELEKEYQRGYEDGQHDKLIEMEQQSSELHDQIIDEFIRDAINENGGYAVFTPAYVVRTDETTGYYHRARCEDYGCNGDSIVKEPISLDDAIQAGFTACPICNPATYISIQIPFEF